MLELKNISLTYHEEQGPVTVLRDVNLVLESNRFYVITGPNGGGKSSLAKIIMGIYQPTAGRIFLDGQDITDLDVAERARLGIGYAFQQPPRFKGLTVYDLIKIARGPKSGVGCNYLYNVGLCPKDYLNREVNTSLSGGELKRIEIATLLHRELKLAIFDEPEAGIDLWSFSRLTETFQNMHQQNQATTVIISHQERILALADEIVLIAEGQVKQKGPKNLILPQLLSECDCGKDCQDRAVNVDECNR